MLGGCWAPAKSPCSGPAVLGPTSGSAVQRSDLRSFFLRHPALLRVRTQFESWQSKVPAPITKDLIWKSVAYRLGAFAAEFIKPEHKLADRSDQLRHRIELVRAADSISANFAEGYSRMRGKDRLRFYDYSLGSARESRDWWWYWIASARRSARTPTGHQPVASAGRQTKRDAEPQDRRLEPGPQARRLARRSEGWPVDRDRTRRRTGIVAVMADSVGA